MFLAYIQKKMGDKLGVKPGSEMLAAIETAQKTGARFALVDREVGITSQGKGKIYCTQNLSDVVLDEKAYHDWKRNAVNLPGGSHECVMVFEGGSYAPPMYY